MNIRKIMTAGLLIAGFSTPALAIEGVDGYGTGATRAAAETAAINDLLNRYEDVRWITIESCSYTTQWSCHSSGAAFGTGGGW